MGGKNKSSQLNSNNINTSFNIEQFWKLESYGTVRKNDPVLLTKDEKRAVSILEKTIVLKDGHYEVGLLWKNDRPSLPYNRQLAVQRFNNLEKKLYRNPKLAQKYRDTINEYINRGYTRKLTPDESKKQSDITNYIPNYCVIHPNKTR